MLRTARHDGIAGDELAFTVVEMIVALVVLSIVLASLSTFISGMWRTASDTTARGRAQAQSNDVLTTFGNDLRQAMHPNRATRDVNRHTLRALIVADDAASKELLSDIVEATDDTIWMWSDAVADADGARECVGYVDEPDDGLVRSVYASSAGCPASGEDDLIESDVIASTRIGDRATTPRFRYVLTYNPTLHDASLTYDVKACTTQRNVAMSDGVPADLPAVNALPSIAAVQIDGLTQEKSGAIQSGAVASYAITARNTRPYQFGLGCAY